MREVVVASGARTAIGEFEGAIKNVSALELGKTVIIEAIKRAGIRKEDVDEAVKAARAVFEKWCLVPAPKRGDIMRKIGDLLVAKKEEIAREMTREMGKVLDETRGDVQEGIDTAYYAATEGRRLFGNTVPSELPNKFAMAIRVPIGVTGIITPWNFPMAIPTWKMFPAILSGNTCVFKPASDTPRTVSVHAANRDK